LVLIEFMLLQFHTLNCEFLWKAHYFEDKKINLVPENTLMSNDYQLKKKNGVF